MKTEQRAFAKINLTLDITSVLPDRYHAIFTAMQTVSLYDTVMVETANESGIALTCSDGSLPCDARNTAYRAAEFFLEAAEEHTGLTIHIDKKIPAQAGLAGGSADAAAVLRALAELFPGRLTEQQLREIAFRIGADVPFCLTGGTQLCLNKGEIMAPLPPLRTWAVIVKPEENVSTKTAYERFDSAVGLFHPDNDKFLFFAAQGEYQKALTYAVNTFEALTEIGCAAPIKTALYAAGAYYAAMSGSGSAFFGLFHAEANARRAAEQLRQTQKNVFVCRTV